MVEALSLLGCEIFYQDDFHVHLAYKATIWQAIPKRPLSIRFQQLVLRALDIAEHEYIEAIERLH